MTPTPAPLVEAVEIAPDVVRIRITPPHGGASVWLEPSAVAEALRDFRRAKRAKTKRVPRPPAPPPRRLIGRRIGDLTVLEYLEGKAGRALYLCRCQCGALLERRASRLYEADSRGARSACPACVSRAKTERARRGSLR